LTFNCQRLEGLRKAEMSCPCVFGGRIATKTQEKQGQSHFCHTESEHRIAGACR